MNDLKAKKGTKPPKKDKRVLCLTKGIYRVGHYCPECMAWLIDGEFVSPIHVTWYKEIHHAKKTTRSKA